MGTVHEYRFQTLPDGTDYTWNKLSSFVSFSSSRQVYYSITDLRRIFLQSESAQTEDNRKQGN